MTTDFGADTSCTDTMRTGRLVSGARLVAEAASRRLITPRGTLLGGDDEADYGLDVTELVGTVATASDAAALPGRIRSELLKDDRLESVDVTVTRTTAAGGASVTFEVTVDGTTADGPFSLVLAVSDVTVDLLGIEVT